MLPSDPIRMLLFHRQPTLASVPSVKPTDTCTPCALAVMRILDSAGLSRRTACDASIMKKSCDRMGACTAVQTGNPEMKDSGKTIRLAPLRAASEIQSQAFSTVFAVFRKTGAAWQDAAL